MKDRATEHAYAVVYGKEKGEWGQLHYLACKRHLEDLTKQDDPDFPYYWDEAESQRIIEFSETLILGEGEEARPLILLDCQAFDLGCNFGWLKKANGKRRFKERYLCMARQNGKSMLNGLTAVYMGLCSGYQYGHIYFCATRKKQSRISWEEAKKFIQSDPELDDLFKVRESTYFIECLPTKCQMEALSREGGTLEGQRSIYCSNDEFHQQKDDNNRLNMKKGQRSVEGALMSTITTRGRNINYPIKAFDDRCCTILKGFSTADDLFIDIYAPDEGDDYWDEKTWKKANPFIFAPGNEELVKKFHEDAKEAKELGGVNLADFLVKSVNIWVQHTDGQYIDDESWKKCGTSLSLDDFKGKRAFMGLDLSSGGDLTSLALLIPYTDPETLKPKYYIYQHSFIPRGRFMEHIETDLAPYDLWKKMGLVTITGGSEDFITDYSFILSYTRDLVEKYDLEIVMVGVDPYNFAGIKQRVEEEICPLILSVRQSHMNLHPSTEGLRLDIKSGNVAFTESDELMTWAFLNAEVVRNSYDEIKIDKKGGKREARIDVADAVIDARYAKAKWEESGMASIDVNSEFDKFFETWGL